MCMAARTVHAKAGTVGALAVAESQLVLCASFAVAAATARFLQVGDIGLVTFVITGEDGRAEEDLACAQCITVHDEESAPYLRRARASRAAADLADGVRLGYQGIHPDDLEVCLEPDRFPFAMVASREDTRMTLRPTVPVPP